MSWYIRPDEIIAEIRKTYPSEKLTGPPRPIAPRVTFSNEHLYGALIYVYGEGFKGQYLRHAYFDRSGVRYWMIEYGWVSLYGKLADGKILPVVMLGIPTRFIYEYKPREFKNFILEEIPMGYMECMERQLVNIERVMAGEDPVIVVDKYDLLVGNGRATPAEVIERIKEQQGLIEALQKTLWEYEKSIADYKTNLSILQARLAKYQELITAYESKLARLSAEVTGIQQELIRLREETLVRGVMAETSEEVKSRLRSLVDELTDIVKEISAWTASIRESITPATPPSGKVEEKPEEESPGGEES